MKETFYFSHDYNARSDPKVKKLIQRHGMQGFGIFWALVEDLYQNANALPTDYESIAYDMRTQCEIIESIINDFGLFQVVNGVFSSDSIDRRISDRNDKSVKAKKSAEARWNKQKNANALQNDANAYENDASAMREECDRNAIKESKEKEIKEKENKVNPSLQEGVKGENFGTKFSDTHTLGLNTPLQSEEKINSPPVAGTPPLIGDGQLQAECRIFAKANANLYTKELYIDFLNYWTAKILNGKKSEIGKERWRVEKTFQLASRLSTWYNRNPNQYGTKSGLNTPKNLGSTAVFSDNKDYSGTGG